MSSADNHKKRIVEDLKQLYSLARKSGRTLPYILKREISAIDIIGWLADSGSEEKWYWKSRGGQVEIGGLGSALSLWSDRSGTAVEKITAIHDLLRPGNLIWLSGQRFSQFGIKDQIWAGYPEEIFTIPKTMMVRNDHRYELLNSMMVTPESNIDGLIADAAAFENSSPKIHSTRPDYHLPTPTSVHNHPDRNGWRRNIEKSLGAIASGQIKKIVMARRTDYKFDQDISPLRLLSQLISQNTGSYAFMYQPRQGTAFVSVSPERLYRRTDDLIEIDALSSTLPRGANPEEDRQFERELLSSDKLRREQQFVIDGIKSAVNPIIDQAPIVGKTSVLKLDRIQHLTTPISGQVRDEIGDDEIIKALHPTPAVGGLPRPIAIDLIGQMEPFDRGWYAAPIGIISGNNADFAVGIRSLVVRGATVSIFTGAGIVAGSDPDAEWQEIDGKNILQPMLAEQVMP
jgi:menaquinone-specific isochorismate synthase